MRRLLELLGIGLVAGFLSALFGVGGGVVIVPLLLARGWPIKVATATSLAAIIATAVFGAVRYSWSGDVDFSDARADRTTGGRRHHPRHPSAAEHVRCAAAARLRRADGCGRTQAGDLLTSALVIAALGVLAGVISGLFGVGGGIIFVPALTLILGRHQLQAEATSLAAIVPVAIVGSWRQNREGLVRWKTAAIIGVASIGGVLAGAEVATSLSNKALERAFGIFLVAASIQLGWKAWRARQAAPLAEPELP